MSEQAEEQIHATIASKQHYVFHQQCSDTSPLYELKGICQDRKAAFDFAQQYYSALGGYHKQQRIIICPITEFYGAD